MAVTTLYEVPNTSQKPKALYYILVVLAAVLILYFGYGFVKNIFNLAGKSSLSADVYFGNARIFLDGEEVGTTPFQKEEVRTGEHKVTLKNDNMEFDISLDFEPNTWVEIKRDLGTSPTFSGGQIFWLDKADSDVVLNVVSEPAGADVFVDGTKVGQTPFTSADLTPGSYDLRLEFKDYEAQTARIEVHKDYKLNVSSTLFPYPVPESVSGLQDSTVLYDVSSSNPLVISDPSAWVKAIAYWNSTRGINLAGVGVNKEAVFDFYLDFLGNIYDSNGNKVETADTGFIKDAKRGAYLRRASDGAGLSATAQNSYLGLGASEGGRKMATILETGTGWLRVRDQAGLNGAEVTRVNVGEEYEVLEETGGWVKLKISPAVEGWVSADYVDIAE